MVLKRIFSHYLPVCSWMILIFYFSSQQKISVSPTFILNFILFKSLHVIEYAILFALWCWAIANKKNFFTQETYLWAGITTLMYAVFDEIHQTILYFDQNYNGNIYDGHHDIYLEVAMEI